MDRKTLSVGIGIFLVVASAAVITFLFGRPAALRGTSYDEPYPIAPDFSLTRADGETFRLSDQRGKVVMLFFGYTSCPDICPTTLGEMKQTIDRLSPDYLEHVQVVAVNRPAGCRSGPQVVARPALCSRLARFLQRL